MPPMTTSTEKATDADGERDADRIAEGEDDDEQQHQHRHRRQVAHVGLRLLVDGARGERRAAVVDGHAGELALGGGADLLLDAQLARPAAPPSRRCRGSARKARMSAARPSGETKLPTANSRDSTLSRSAWRPASSVGMVGTSESTLGAPMRARDDVGHRRQRQDEVDAAHVLDGLRGAARSSPATPARRRRRRRAPRRRRWRRASEPKRRETSSNRRTSGSFVGRKTSRSSSLRRRVVPTAASGGDDETEGDDGTGPAGGEGDELIHRQRR